MGSLDRKQVLFVLPFLLLLVFGSGCATPRPPFTALEVPSDKALVYAYWERARVVKGGLVTIHVNGEPKFNLFKGSYYPLIVPPGKLSMGYSFVIHGFRIKKE